MRIGIECELNSNSVGLGLVLHNELLSLGEFKEHLNIPGILTKMSEEYYRSTLEYNFEPIDSNNWEQIDKIIAFLSTQVTRYGLNLNSRGPSFVGTHIHIFDTKFKRKRRKPIFKALLKFILENIDDLEYASLSRLYEGHQLWCRWDFQNDKVWSRHLKERGVFNIGNNSYQSYSSKPKYGPVIHSAPNLNTGKPASLEIRFIPNELLFNKKIFKFLKTIEDKTFLNEQGVDEDIFLNEIYARLGRLSSTMNEEILRKNFEKISSMSLVGLSPRETIRNNGLNITPFLNEWMDIALKSNGRGGDIVDQSTYTISNRDEFGNIQKFKYQIHESRDICTLKMTEGLSEVRSFGVPIENSNRYFLYKGYVVDKNSSSCLPLIDVVKVFDLFSQVNSIDEKDMVFMYNSLSNEGLLDTNRTSQLKIVSSNRTFSGMVVENNGTYVDMNNIGRMYEVLINNNTGDYEIQRPIDICQGDDSDR